MSRITNFVDPLLRETCTRELDEKQSSLLDDRPHP